MKIEKLTDNKIRIILNTDDLLEKNIDVKSLINNTDIAQDLFKQILKCAEKEVGFVVADSKLLIEAFVSSEGFFVITFTKFKSDIKNTSNKKSKLKVKRKTLYPSCKNVAFMFNNFEEFCNFCTYLNNINFTTKLAKKIILYEYNFRYYLVLSNITDTIDVSPFYSAISEFAKIVSDSTNFECKLLERGKIIFKNNAIENGIKYFV